jgi:hypothetical protein
LSGSGKKMKIEDINKGIDVVAKLAAPIGVIIMIWLQSQFVTRVEFQKIDDRISKIEQVLIRMEANAEADKRHEIVLADHEQRIREIEKK